MQSMAGFRAALAVAVVTMELAVFAMVPVVNSAPVNPNQDLSRGGDREAPYNVQSSPDRRGIFVSTMNSPERREKFLKILMALEELNRSINSSMSSRITMMPRAKVLGTGKKNKAVVSGETQQAATVPPVDDGGTVSTSSHPPEPQKGGKGFKKTLPQTPKKPNKRVCFWKYCSQN